MPEVVNTFQNGMNQDSNVVYQPDGTYRFAKNLQLINHDGNNLTLKDALGNRKIFELPATWQSGNPVYNIEPNRMPIGFISFADGEQQLVVFSAFSTVTGGDYGEIGLLSLTNIGQSVDSLANGVTGTNPWFRGYLPLYGHDDLKLSRMHKIEGFAFAENENIRRVYWTDYNNEPRVLNIADPVFTTYYASGSITSPIVAGKQYMVLNGIINYNGVEYGVGIGNVFTATATTTWADVSTGLGMPYPPLVIEYYDVTLLNWTPSRALGNMVFNRYGTGVKRYSSNVYFYRLGKRSAGYFTSWSYGTYPVHVGGANDIVTANTYTNFVGKGSSTTIEVSDKSVKIDIDNIDTSFDIIQLACAEYAQLYTTPYSISIVDETSITGTSMTLEDVGNKNLGNLTLNDITLFPASILKCKTITTNKNYNIIGNITERTQPLFDKSTVTMTSFEYPMPIHGDDQLCANDFLYYNVLPTNDLTNNPAAGTIIPWSRYNVTGGTFNVDYVEYPVASGNRYGVGQPLGNVFIGSAGNNTFTVAGTPVIRPCVNKNKYTTTTGEVRNNAHEIKTGWWDYKDPLVDSELRGLWSHEWYRWGIMWHDLKGNPFYVDWMGDYQMPLISTKGGLLRADNYAGTNMWSLNPSLMRFSGIRITAETAALVSGFSIVRAPRDVRIVAQGLVMQNEYRSPAGAAQVFPVDSINNSAVPVLSPEIYTWISPDNQLIGFPEKTTLGVAGDVMEEACWLKGITWNNQYYRSGNNSVGAACDVYTKQFVARTDTSSGNNLRTTTIKEKGWSDINENQTVTNVFGVANTDYYNGLIPNNTFTTADASCYGAGTISLSPLLNPRRFVGGRKAIFHAPPFAHYNNYPAGLSYTSNGASIPEKILMNYTKNLTTPYGGTGESAIASTLYISTGHFQPINATVLSETETFLGSGIYEFNGVEVAGGDCFTTLVDYGYGLSYNGSPSSPFASSSIGFYFPCESNSNYTLRRGRKISNVGMGNGASYPNGISWTPLILEDYSYNPAYSTEGAQFLYPALPVNFLNSNRFPTRARFAGQKIIGELIDSFRVFLINDYKDVDVQLGEINNLKAKGDYVYYWQNHGVGSMPILERQMISQSQGSATSLGTGGVLSRFDVISTIYGNQHQHGLTNTEDGWIWFDMRNKDVCVMGFGGSAQEITVPTGMKSYFSEVFLERLTELYSGIYLNSQTSDISSDRPLIGTGIVGAYDPKNKMTYLTFKFKSYYKEVVEPTTPEQYQVLSKDFTVGFSHVLNKFVGFYDKTPAIWHNHNQSVLSANDPKNTTKYYGADMALPVTYNVGDSINFGGADEYIFLQDYTLTSYPIGFVNPAIFISLNRTNEIYVENEEKPYGAVIEGYQYNFNYGRVVNNELEIVVTPKAGQVSVTNLEMGSTGDNITDIVISADNAQIGGDSNISSTNRNYKYYDGSWWFNLPLFRGARITDKYLKMRFTKKNWGSDPTIFNGKLTIFQYFKSFFEGKR